MSEERWLDIPGYEGLYQVSDLGAVRSLPRTAKRARGVAKVGGFIMKPILARSSKGNDLRHKYGLSKNGKRRQVHAAWLVALAFIGPRPEGHYVCHNDGDCLNDRLSNLRYDTPWGNSQDRHVHGTTKCGTDINTAKLTPSEVVDIRRLAAIGHGPCEIARIYSMHEATIRAIISRKTWRHVA